MNITGNILKMQAVHVSPVLYSLPIGETTLALNPLIGQQIVLRFEGEINCINCQRKTSKSFQQGYCYPCMQQLARCDLCILKPELCHYHKGTCREPEWGQVNCMIEHVIYLANSSGLKVGITRHTQIPTRWIDQGAVAAIPVARVGSRYDSGRIELALKEYFNDKTNWRDMLKNKIVEIDLVDERARLLPVLQEITRDYQDGVIVEEAVHRFDYPVLNYPVKIKSLSFDKSPRIEGTLLGIKGQYLLFDTGVINIRKHGGYKIHLEY
ncbi:MAG: hypothetical protein HW386_172 [Gammaproteobacteria bacterium]|nr:hypothetical protein [Gammaproteobacteria bacterium]